MDIKKILKTTFFVIGILYSLLYFISCLTPYISQEVWPIFTFLALAFPILFGGMLIWWLMVLVFYRKYWWLFLLILLTGYKNIFSCFALNIPSKFVQEKQPKTIRILTYNVQDFLDSQVYTDTPGNGRRYIMAFIKNSNADIVCIQDFTERESPAFRSSLKDIKGNNKYPYCYFSIDYSYPYSNIPTHYGTAIFSKLPILDSGRINYTGKKFPESLAFADIKFEKDTIRIFNTHFRSMYLKTPVTDSVVIDDFIGEDTKFLYEHNEHYQRLLHFDKGHVQQAKIVQASFKNCTYPFVFCADLNSVPSSFVYHTIKNGLTDAFTAKGFGLGATYDGFSPTIRIDVIMTSNHFKTIQYYSPKLKASDHFPVIADIGFK